MQWKHSERGFLTVDFMLAMVVTLGCMMLLLRVSVSLISVQLGQYVMYAAARAHAASDLTAQDQKAAGELKYQNLLKEAGIVAGFLKPGVTIQKKDVIGDFGRIYSVPSGRDGTEESGIPFVGARAEIKLPRLGFSIPFMGRTADRDEDFKAYVNAMIFREPSNEECRQFFRPERYERLLQRDPRYGRAGTGSTAYVPLEDSGC